MAANGHEWMRMDANECECIGMDANARIAFSPLAVHMCGGKTYKEHTLSKRVNHLIRMPTW